MLSFPRPKFLLPLSLSALIVFCAPQHAMAQAFLTWTGSGNNWSNTGRWSGWDSGGMPFGQLQWTGGGDALGTNNFSGLAQWRMFFNGNTAYTLRGNDINLFDFDGAHGGIMSRASATQTIDLTVRFADTKGNGAFIVTRMGGSGTGGGGGALLLSNIVLSNSVGTLRIGGESGAGAITVRGSIS